MKKVFLYGALLSTIVATVGGASVASAVEYSKDGTSPATAIADGKVKFVNSTDGIIPDPTDPTIPVDPVDPVNPNEDPLRIAYVSNFNFNQRRMSGGMDLVFNAESVPVKSIYSSKTELLYKGRDGSGKDGNGEAVDSAMFGKLNTLEARETMPFVSTLDMRTKRDGWTLSADAGEFVQEGGSKLKGVSIILANANYANNGDAALEKAAPVVEKAAAKGVKFVKLEKGADLDDYNAHLGNVKGALNISNGSQVVAKATAEKGIGGHTLALGDNLFNDSNDLSQKMVDANETADTYLSTNGVILHVPAKTAMEIGKKNEKVVRTPKDGAQRKNETEKEAFYRTKITWTLSPDVK